MAANIFELDESRVILGSNKPGWHGLGTTQDGLITAMQARKALGFPVGIERLTSEHGVQIPADVARMIVRLDLPKDDSRRFFATCGKDYHVIPGEVTVGFTEALIGESGAKFETCGTLKNGRVLWTLCKLPESIKIGEVDSVQPYLMVKTSHDMSGAFEAFLTLVRVVCWNTFLAALRSANKIKIKHTVSAKVNIKEARRIIGLAKDETEETANQLNAMAAKSLDNEIAAALVNVLYPDRAETNNKRVKSVRDDVMRLFRSDLTGMNKDTRGTAYGLYNALTEYLDHRSGPRTTTKSTRVVAENRFASILTGNIAKQRGKAFNVINRAFGFDGGKAVLEQVLEAQRKPLASSETVDNVLAGIEL